MIKASWEFAKRHLKDGVRASSGETMLSHAARVARVVRGEFGIAACEVLALAVLHDVIEDGDVSIGALERQFGKDMAGNVVVLTKPLLGPKSMRRDLYLRVISGGSNAAKLVKLADFLDNLRSRRGTAREPSTRRGAGIFIAHLRAHPQSSTVRRAMKRLQSELSGKPHRDARTQAYS